MKGRLVARFVTRAEVMLVAAGWLLTLQLSMAAGYTAPSAPVVLAAQQASSKPSTQKINPSKWAGLTADQKVALEPLSKVWDSLPSNRQLKWLAVAANYNVLSPADQVKLQSRMKDWVALEPKQRDQARIGFATTQKLSPEDKKVKWEAYQALSPDARAQLAAQGEKKVGAAAKPIAPVPADRKVNMPPVVRPQASAATAGNRAGETAHSKPKLANVAESVSPQTLLPNLHP